MPHIVLLGDSIFDNAAYVAGGPDVRAQLQGCLPEDWHVTLLAVDGSQTPDVASQLQQLPRDTTHLVLSVGGNDALDHIDFLTDDATTVAEVLDRLAAIADAFEETYHRLVQEILQPQLPIILCTIYYPRFPDPAWQRLAVTALTVFNDVIFREALRAGMPLIDLRLTCDEDTDYANPIEPSALGGAKIAAAIATVVREHDFTQRRTVVFV
jgi:lysophospholipase L1-like esterase